MKKLFLVIAFGLIAFAISAQNKFRISGIGIDMAAIPAKYNSKAFNSEYPVKSSETAWARDVLATLSLYFNNKLNLLAGFGYQWHTINPKHNLFSSQAKTSVLYKVGLGAEYCFYERKRFKGIIQGMFNHENFSKKRTKFYVDELIANQTVRKELDFYGNGGNRQSFELRGIYSYNLTKHTRAFAGAGFNIGFYATEEKTYYEGPPYEVFIPYGSSYTLNIPKRRIERYYFFHFGIRTDIFVKKKD